MKNEELKYQPSEEEVEKAESMMTDEQKEATEIRERYKVQEKDPFDNFNDYIDDGIRREATEDEKEKMDSQIKELGGIFDGSDINWHIDGAMNISFMNGEYIGIHKDVDISVEKNELEKLDGVLKEKGYGLFLSTKKEPDDKRSKRIVERVDYKTFQEAPENELQIAAIDDNGRVLDEADLNFVDVHVVSRDENGNPVNKSGVPMPREWYEGKKIDYKGNEINISHPAKVAYFKFHGIRDYDYEDLKILAKTGELTMEDVQDMKNVIEEDLSKKEEGAKQLIEDVVGKITPDISSDGIYQIFLDNPDIAKKIEDEKNAENMEVNIMENAIKGLSDLIANEEDKSFENIYSIVYDANIKPSNEAMGKKIDNFEKLVKEGIDLKNVREDFRKIGSRF